MKARSSNFFMTRPQTYLGSAIPLVVHQTNAMTPVCAAALSLRRPRLGAFKQCQGWKGAAPPQRKQDSSPRLITGPRTRKVKLASKSSVHCRNAVTRCCWVDWAGCDSGFARVVTIALRNQHYRVQVAIGG